MNLRTTEEYAENEIDPKDVETLLSMVEPGDTIYSVTRKVGRNGTYRCVSFLAFPVVDGKAQLKDLTLIMQKILGKEYKVIDEPSVPYCIRVGPGSTSDFFIVYNLARKVFQSSPGNDAGYAFNHKWL